MEIIKSATIPSVLRENSEQKSDIQWKGRWGGKFNAIPYTLQCNSGISADTFK